MVAIDGLKAAVNATIFILPWLLPQIYNQQGSATIFGK